MTIYCVNMMPVEYRMTPTSLNLGQQTWYVYVTSVSSKRYFSFKCWLTLIVLSIYIWMVFGWCARHIDQTKTWNRYTWSSKLWNIPYMHLEY